MTPLQALSLLQQVVEQSRLTAAEHRKLQEAIGVLAIMAKPEDSPKVES
jgi:hypothetical protein